MIALKREILQELLKSERWRRRLENAETLPAVSAVLQSFCEKTGRTVEHLPLTDTQRHFVQLMLLIGVGVVVCLLIFAYMVATGFV